MAPSAADSTRITDALHGAMLGDYQVVRTIGEGGMGVVYEGLHTIINKRVAIKVIRSEYAGDQVLVRRVLTEAQAVNAVRHRGIVDIHAHGTTPDGRPYLVMELLEGETVHDLLQREPRLPFEDALQLLLEATGPLHAAHKAGIIHRDLKPSNLFLCVDDDGERFLKLLDFGLAKRQAQSGTSSTMTSASLIVGTPDYMAPEQARAQPTDARTDIYALGIMAFELFAGKLPYSAQTSVDLVMKHLTAPIPRLIDFDPEIPEDLSELVEQMMAKEVVDRPQSLEPVRAVLKSHLRRPSGSGKVRPRSSAVRPVPVTPAYLQPTMVRSLDELGAKPPHPRKPSASRSSQSRPSVEVEEPAAQDNTTTALGLEPVREPETTQVAAEALPSEEPPQEDARNQSQEDPQESSHEERSADAAPMLEVPQSRPSQIQSPTSVKFALVAAIVLAAVIGIGLAIVFNARPSQGTKPELKVVVIPNAIDQASTPSILPPVASVAVEREVQKGDVVDAGTLAALGAGGGLAAEPPVQVPRQEKVTERPSTRSGVRRPATREELAARIQKLRTAAQNGSDPTIGLFLNKYEADLGNARSPEALARLAEKLDELQKKHRLRVR